MSTLFEIGADMEALHAILSDVGGDVTDADAEAAIDAWLSENEAHLQGKLEGYRSVLRALEASAAFRKAEAAVRLDAARRDEANVERMKSRLLWFFRAHGMDRVDLPSGGRFSLSKNGGKAPVTLLCAPEELPEPFRETVTTVRARTDDIRAALESGEALPFAVIEERGVHLRVK